MEFINEYVDFLQEMVSIHKLTCHQGIMEEGEQSQNFLDQLLYGDKIHENDFEKRAIFNLTDYIKSLTTDQVFSNFFVAHSSRLILLNLPTLARSPGEKGNSKTHPAFCKC